MLDTVFVAGVELTTLVADLLALLFAAERFFALFVLVGALFFATLFFAVFVLVGALFFTDFDFVFFMGIFR